MSLNLIFIIFLNISFFIIIKTNNNIDIIEKYSKKEINSRKAILITSGFSFGNEIYISIITHGSCIDGLYYKFYEDIYSSNEGSLYGSNTVYSKSVTTETIMGNTKKTYNYMIEKDNSNGNYLYFEHDCALPVTIENTEDDVTDSFLLIIILVIVGFVIFVVIIIISAICICRRCRRTNYGAVVYPNSFGYGVSPYVVPPGVVQAVQPIVQPVMNVQPYVPSYPQNQNINYNGNVQYEQINQVQSGEERINQPINQQKYEKPKK